MTKKMRPSSIRRLLAIITALALLFAPSFSHAGATMAAIPDHDMQMMQGGHCTALPSNNDRQGKNAAMSCCIATYLAVAPSFVEPSAQRPVRAAQPSFRLAALHRPHLGELPTPPPRAA